MSDPVPDCWTRLYTQPTVHAIAYSIPAFGLLIGLELWLAQRKRRHLFRFGDAVCDISCGIGQQALGIFIAAATLAVYLWFYEFRLIEFSADSLWTWVLAMIGVDFVYYWWHRLSHECNLLWAVHIVHHQSEDYNLAVALRQAYISGPTAILFHVPLALLGVPPAVWLLSRAVNLLYQFWIHTELVGKLGWYGKLFNTPSHHRVHHAINPQYLDRNYAGILIIWDRLFGSFEPEQERPVYGTTKPLQSYNAVWANVDHLANIARKAAGVRGIGQRLRAVFDHPGWSPGEEEPGLTKMQLQERRERKYDPKAPRWLQIYVALWLLAVSGAVMALLIAYAQMPTWASVSAVTLIVLTTACWGGLLERKRWAWLAEGSRLVACGVWAAAWFVS